MLQTKKKIISNNYFSTFNQKTRNKKVLRHTLRIDDDNDDDDDDDGGGGDGGGGSGGGGSGGGDDDDDEDDDGGGSCGDDDDDDDDNDGGGIDEAMTIRRLNTTKLITKQFRVKTNFCSMLLCGKISKNETSMSYMYFFHILVHSSVSSPSRQKYYASR